MHGTLKTLRTPRTEGTETQWSSSLPTRLPRARRALADDAVVTWDGPYPYGGGAVSAASRWGLVAAA
jgi:hypothetical protein